MATNLLRDTFGSLNIRITDESIRNLEKVVIWFETRGTHPLALNSMALAIHPIVFTDADRDALFRVFRLSEQQVYQQVKRTTCINTEFVVSSDPFAVLSVWLLHLATEQIADAKKRSEFMLLIAKYLHYRWFTSLIHNWWEYGADEAVMLYTVSMLSKKFDLVSSGTWRAAIEQRCMDYISDGSGTRKKSIHYDTFVSGGDDALYLSPGGLGYAITDPQTRLRDRIGIFGDLYYANHRNGNKIKSSSATTTNADGEKILVEKKATLDSMTSKILVDITNVNAFVVPSDIHRIVGEFPAVSASLLTAALERLSLEASRQLTSKEIDRIEPGANGRIIYIGIRALVDNLIQVSFRYCINNQIPLRDKLRIWNDLRNIYTASRVNDIHVLEIKDSVSRFVEESDLTQRESTKSSLRIAIIMYIIFKCLKSM